MRCRKRPSTFHRVWFYLEYFLAYFAQALAQAIVPRYNGGVLTEAVSKQPQVWAESSPPTRLNIKGG
jgi:hypothetical protein